MFGPSTSFPCIATGRYVVIRRTNGLLGVTNNAIATCEIQVYASPLTNQPSPRAGSAAATYGGQMIVFGGYDASGSRLSDTRMFNMLTNKWMLPIPPLAGPPPARSYSGLVPMPAALIPVSAPAAPVPSGRVVLMGGNGNIDSLGDVWELQFPACPPMDTTALDISPTGTRFYYGASVWWPACVAGTSTPNNAPSFPLVCGVDGRWVGSTPCSVRTPGPPQNVQITPQSALADDIGAAIVSWTPPVDLGGTGNVDYYDVRAMVSGFT